MITNFGSKPNVIVRIITEAVITIGFLYLVRTVFNFILVYA